MKEYEKLAKELADNAATDTQGDLEYGFIRGFLKAREMTVQYAKIACEREFIIKDIQDIGEKEV